MPLVGAPTEVREVDEAIAQIANIIKSEVESQTGLNFQEYVPLTYKSQLVNGVNYFIKVRHGPSQHLHLRVHKSFQGEIKLAGIQLDKTLEDDLAYFQ